MARSPATQAAGAFTRHAAAGALNPNAAAAARNPNATAAAWRLSVRFSNVVRFCASSVVYAKLNSALLFKTTTAPMVDGG